MYTLYRISKVIFDHIINRKFTNVFVHCYAGVSRSVAIVCAYIMWKFKWNY
jgi:protein-tyrosine phosphatase